MSSQSLEWVSYPVTWMVIPGWTEIIRPTEVMALCLLSEVLLIHPNLFFPLLLHEFLWDLPNIQANQGS